MSHLLKIELPERLQEEAALISRLLGKLDSFDESRKSEVMELMKKHAINKARVNFYWFLRYFAEDIIPEGFKDGRHIRYMCKKLQEIETRVLQGEQVRVGVYLPPGSMKSKMLNLFVCWLHGRHPKWDVLHIGHGSKFATRNFGRPIRDIIKSPKYLEVFPRTRIRSDARSSDFWQYTEGGKYHCNGAGASIAGMRARIGIVDDALSEQTAKSDVETHAINEWYVPGFRSRLLPGGSAEIVVNTRWRMDDLSGFLEEIDKESPVPWEIIKFPAVLLPGEYDDYLVEELGLKEGLSFWPELWPTKLMLEKKASNTPQMWSALYQQSPIPADGNIFKVSNFKHLTWTDLENLSIEYTVLSMDTAYSAKESADFSAYSVWGLVRPVGQRPFVVLLEAGKGRWEFPELVKRTVELYHEWDPDSVVVENRASGQSLIQDLHRRMIPVVPYNPDKDKVTRAHAITPFLEAGSVYVLVDSNGKPLDYAQMLLTEAMQFPHGQFDDMTDTMTQALLWLRDNNILTHHYDEYKDDEQEEDIDNIIGFRTYWRR